MLVAILAIVFSQEASGASELSAARIEIGQEWTYKMRDSDPDSTLIIGAIDEEPAGDRTVHITVEGLRIRNPQAENGFSQRIGHLPISEKSLLESLGELVRRNATVESVHEGIKIWREAKGGVFSVTVAEAVQYVEDTLRE